MDKVKRYGRIGEMVEATEGLLKLYPMMSVYVLAADFDHVAAELTCALWREGRLQESLKLGMAENAVAKETLGRWHELNLQREARVGELERLLREANEYVPGYVDTPTELWRRIEHALKTVPLNWTPVKAGASVKEYLTVLKEGTGDYDLAVTMPGVIARVPGYSFEFRPDRETYSSAPRFLFTGKPEARYWDFRGMKSTHFSDGGEIPGEVGYYELV